MDFWRWDQENLFSIRFNINSKANLLRYASRPFPSFHKFETILRGNNNCSFLKYLPDVWVNEGLLDRVYNQHKNLECRINKNRPKSMHEVCPGLILHLCFKPKLLSGISLKYQTGSNFFRKMLDGVRSYEIITFKKSFKIRIARTQFLKTYR